MVYGMTLYLLSLHNYVAGLKRMNLYRYTQIYLSLHMFPLPLTMDIKNSMPTSSPSSAGGALCPV
jgi:hypothetical protein